MIPSSWPANRFFWYSRTNRFRRWHITFRASEPALTSSPYSCFIRPNTSADQRPPRWAGWVGGRREAAGAGGPFVMCCRDPTGIASNPSIWSAWARPTGHMPFHGRAYTARRTRTGVPYETQGAGSSMGSLGHAQFRSQTYMCTLPNPPISTSSYSNPWVTSTLSISRMMSPARCQDRVKLVPTQFRSAG